MIPTVEVTDYSTESVEVFEGSASPPYHTHSSLSPPSKKSAGKRRAKPATYQSGSDDQEQDKPKMSLRPSKRHSSKSSGKSKHKTDDWNEVTEPEERRRIQNRIAQRKFRMLLPLP